MTTIAWPSLAGSGLFQGLGVLAFHPVFCIVFAGILGACFGSFINVVGMRYPAALLAAWKREARAVLGLDEQPSCDSSPGGQGAAGAAQAAPVYQEDLCSSSRCPHCQHRIRWRDNIPILGWLLLLGRCRDCKAGISIVYPVTEALGAAGCAGMVAWLGPNATGLAGCVLWLLALTLALIDIRELLLPDTLVYTLLWAGLLGAVAGLAGFPTPDAAIMGAAAGYAGLWLVGNGYSALRKIDGLGGGDVKLYAAAGAWCGWGGLIPVLVVATGCGLLLGVGRLACGRRGVFPFGPALLAGILVQWLFPHWMQPILTLLAH